MMPPARAVFDGVAGASTRSVAARPYARPSGLLPSRDTKNSASRAPSPVLMTPREMKNATTISQIVVFENPDSASAGSSTPVTTVATRPTIVTAPIGSGRAMTPTMVATKIANMCQAGASTPAGGGTNQSTTPTTSGIAVRTSGTGRSRAGAGAAVPAPGGAAPPGGASGGVAPGSGAAVSWAMRGVPP